MIPQKCKAQSSAGSELVISEIVKVDFKHFLSAMTYTGMCT